MYGLRTGAILANDGDTQTTFTIHWIHEGIFFYTIIKKYGAYFLDETTATTQNTSELNAIALTKGFELYEDKTLQDNDQKLPGDHLLLNIVS